MMTEKNKMDCDNLLKTHEMTQVIIDPETADSAMLATVVQMVRNGEDDMALYMLHNLKPFALKVEEKKTEPEEPDIGDLLKAIFG